jgi:membrane protease subunit (stomatin/prohibitin family)
LWGQKAVSFAPPAALTTKAGVSVLTGTVHTYGLNGNSEVREAQKQVVQFNALARSAPETTKTDNDLTARLQKLQELREAGMLSQEEYDTKRAEIIASI